MPARSSASPSWPATWPGLRSLAFAIEAPWLVIALLFFGLFITFGSVSLAANLMLLARGEQDGGSPRDDRDDRRDEGH